jgi:hypothetical protein
MIKSKQQQIRDFKARYPYISDQRNRIERTKSRRSLPDWYPAGKDPTVSKVLSVRPNTHVEKSIFQITTAPTVTIERNLRMSRLHPDAFDYLVFSGRPILWGECFGLLRFRGAE